MEDSATSAAAAMLSGSPGSVLCTTACLLSADSASAGLLLACGEAEGTAEAAGAEPWFAAAPAPQRRGMVACETPAS